MMNNLEQKITDLEVRLTHQDAAIDELTKVVLKQEALIKGLSQELKHTKQLLKELPHSAASATGEELPPHY